MQKDLQSLTGWEKRLARATQLLAGSTPYPETELAIAAESFYKKLVAADVYKPSGTYNGPVKLVKSTDNYVSLDKDYGLTPVSRRRRARIRTNLKIQDRDEKDYFKSRFLLNLNITSFMDILRVVGFMCAKQPPQERSFANTLYI